MQKMAGGDKPVPLWTEEGPSHVTQPRRLLFTLQLRLKVGHLLIPCSLFIIACMEVTFHERRGNENIKYSLSLKFIAITVFAFLFFSSGYHHHSHNSNSVCSQVGNRNSGTSVKQSCPEHQPASPCCFRPISTHENLWKGTGTVWTSLTKQMDIFQLVT